MMSNLYFQLTHLKIWLILIFTWIIIASTYLAIKISIDTIPPMLMSGIRYTLSGGLLFLIFKLYSINFIKIKRKPIKDTESKSQQHENSLLKIITKEHWKAATIAGISLIVGGQGLLAYGEQYLSSDITALLFSTVPIWIALIGKFHYKIGLNTYTILGIILGLIGLGILIFPSLEAMLLGNQNSDSTSTTSNFLGIIILLIAAIIWAVGSLYSNHANLPDNILISTGMFLFTGGIILLFISIIIGEFNDLNLSEFSTESIFSLLYLIMIGSMGWLGFFWILRNSTPTIANTFAYVSPVIAVFLGWLLLNESIDLRVIVATVVIIVGVIFLVQKRKLNK